MFFPARGRRGTEGKVARTNEYTIHIEVRTLYARRIFRGNKYQFDSIDFPIGPFRGLPIAECSGTVARAPCLDIVYTTRQWAAVIRYFSACIFHGDPMTKSIFHGDPHEQMHVCFMGIPMKTCISHRGSP